MFIEFAMFTELGIAIALEAKYWLDIEAGECSPEGYRSRQSLLDFPNYFQRDEEPMVIIPGREDCQSSVFDMLVASIPDELISSLHDKMVPDELKGRKKRNVN